MTSECSKKETHYFKIIFPQRDKKELLPVSQNVDEKVRGISKHFSAIPYPSASLLNEAFPFGKQRKSILNGIRAVPHYLPIFYNFKNNISSFIFLKHNMAAKAAFACEILWKERDTLRTGNNFF